MYGRIDPVKSLLWSALAQTWLATTLQVAPGCLSDRLKARQPGNQSCQPSLIQSVNQLSSQAQLCTARGTEEDDGGEKWCDGWLLTKCLAGVLEAGWVCKSQPCLRFVYCRFVVLKHCELNKLNVSRKDWWNCHIAVRFLRPDSFEGD